MLNDINIDKILERQENGNIYIVHVIANQQVLSIEIQDKMKGDIWSEEFPLQKIQEITLKAKNPKKYAVFIKMLMSSLYGQTESVLIQILTYSQLQRKMNLTSRGRNIQNNKKYMIMTYMSQFDKAHYPLPLSYQQNPSTQRLKITIRRLAQQLSLNGEQRNQNAQMKQLSMLKYQNESLKARIKTLQQKLHQHSSLQQNSMNKSNISMSAKTQQSSSLKSQVDNLKTILVSKDSQILQKKSQIQQLKKQLQQISNQKKQQQQQILTLKKQLSQNSTNKKQLKQQEQTYQLLEEKINQMNQQTGELVSELQHAREIQKKNLLKIQNLQKQLEKMVALQQKNSKSYVSNNKNVFVNKLNQNNKDLNSSRKTLSEKSFGSQRSQKSGSNVSGKKKTTNIQAALQSYNNNSRLYDKNQKKLGSSSRRSSVYESDTESSKLRKANNTRVSPYRQVTTKPVQPKQKSISSKKSGKNNFTSTMNNRFDRNILSKGRDRSRSKSRSVKKQNSPPAEFPTDNFASSSQDQRNVTQALIKLKQRKNKVQLNQKSKQNKKDVDRNVMGPLQKKITNIAQMLRKAKSRERND